MFKNNELLPVFSVIAAVFLWGASFSGMKVVLAVFDPMSVMWMRLTLASLVLLPFLPRMTLRIQKKDWKYVAPMVLFQPCLYFAFESNAILYTTSAQAGIVAAIVPLLVAVGAWLTLGERINLRILSGLALAIAGVSWLSLSGSATESASNPLLGNFLEFCAMVCAAVAMLVMKRMSARYGPWTLTALQTFVGAVFFLPGASGAIQGWELLLSDYMLPLIIFLSIGVTIGAFGCYNFGMSRIPASRASTYINLVPVVAAGLGWIILGESLNSTQLAAAVIVLAGVHISQRPDRLQQIESGV